FPESVTIAAYCWRHSFCVRSKPHEMVARVDQYTCEPIAELDCGWALWPENSRCCRAAAEAAQFAGRRYCRIDHASSHSERSCKAGTTEGEELGTTAMTATERVILEALLALLQAC